MEYGRRARRGRGHGPVPCRWPDGCFCTGVRRCIEQRRERDTAIRPAPCRCACCLQQATDSVSRDPDVTQSEPSSSSIRLAPTLQPATPQTSDVIGTLDAERPPRHGLRRSSARASASSEIVSGSPPPTRRTQGRARIGQPLAGRARAAGGQATGADGTQPRSSRRWPAVLSGAMMSHWSTRDAVVRPTPDKPAAATASGSPHLFLAPPPAPPRPRRWACSAVSSPCCSIARGGARRDELQLGTACSTCSARQQRSDTTDRHGVLRRASAGTVGALVTARPRV